MDMEEWCFRTKRLALHFSSYGKIDVLVVDGFDDDNDVSSATKIPVGYLYLSV